jgi:hypothetical protein
MVAEDVDQGSHGDLKYFVTILSSTVYFVSRVYVVELTIVEYIVILTKLTRIDLRMLI